MSAIKEIAWLLSMVSAIVGTTMVAVGMTEELLAITRSTVCRTFKR
jgi:hypothetical protein